jgi:hypothetical protein
MGFGAEYISNRIMHTMRGYISSFGAEKIEKYGSNLLRWTGLEGLTNASRSANMLSFSRQLGDMVGVKYDDLNAALLKEFKNFGINEADWDIIRQNGLVNRNDINFISPSKLVENHLEVAEKLGDLAAKIKEKGTPSESIALRKFKAKAYEAGVGQALAAEGLSTFQSFNASVFTNWLVPAVRGTDRTSIFAKLAAYSFLTGIGVEFLNNTAKNETTNFADPKLYTSAAGRAGFASFYGDLIQWGGDQVFGGYQQPLVNVLGQRALGPILGGVGDIGAALMSAAVKAGDNKETSLAYDLAKAAKKFDPLAQNYLTGAIWSDKVWGSILETLDETKYKKEERLKAARQKKEGVKPII